MTTPLGARIAAVIAAQGPIPVPEFMAMALYDAQGGYYATRDPLGARGDFITAPEISQLFGELCGLWLAQCWHDQGKPARPLLVELGPGRGTLMRDALRAMKLIPEFHGALDVVLVEASPILKERQRELLADCGVAVQWADTFDAILPERPVFLIANEFFDALPIRQYVKMERGWCERMVSLDASGALTFVLSPVPYPTGNMPANRHGAPLGGLYETSPAGEAIAQAIGHAIAARGGAALIVDYGYAAPSFGETLQAVESHGFADVLASPGKGDLSSHVDFTKLGDAAVHGGAGVYGPQDQGAFLLALGAEQRAQRLGTLDALARLTAPDKMGTLFKALAVVPRSAPIPPGFG